MSWTIEQKMQCAQWLDEYKYVILVQREYRRMFNKKPPSDHSIRSWHQKLKETGNVLSEKPTGRPTISEEIVEMVRKDYLRSPKKSVRKRAEQLGLNKSTVYRILTKSIVGNKLHTALPNMSPPHPLVLCGPSGVGKSTLMKKLMGEFPGSFGFSVSHTTRSPRPGEEHGKAYNFVQRDEMKQAIANGEFIETAEFSGNFYGTSKKAVQDVLDSGKICILDIDMQGVIQIKATDMNPNCVFIKPPSWEDLEKRLRGRGTESEESLAKRLNTAKKELEWGETPGTFSKIIVNDDVEIAYGELKKFMLPGIQSISNGTNGEA